MAERLALIDYGAGNLRSAAKALEVAAERSGRAIEVRVTADPDEVAGADRIVLPGVGAFGQCAAALRAADGMVEAMEHAVAARGRPFLGICVGMQLLAEVGHEHGEHRGLGWIPGEVNRLAPADPSFKVPHMGWTPVRRTPAADAVHAPTPPDGGYAYFVHSFHFEPRDSSHCLATAEHGGSFAAIVGRDNIVGVQFHPEKSQAVGLAFLADFLTWTP